MRKRTYYDEIVSAVADGGYIIAGDRDAADDYFHSKTIPLKLGMYIAPYDKANGESIRVKKRKAFLDSLDMSILDNKQWKEIAPEFREKYQKIVFGEEPNWFLGNVCVSSNLICLTYYKTDCCDSKTSVDSVPVWASVFDIVIDVPHKSGATESYHIQRRPEWTTSLEETVGNIYRKIKFYDGDNDYAEKMEITEYLDIE